MQCSSLHSAWLALETVRRSLLQHERQDLVEALEAAVLGHLKYQSDADRSVEAEGPLL